MSVRTSILLHKEVADLAEAKAWYDEVRKALRDKTTCTMRSSTVNHEEPSHLKKDSHEN